MSSKEEPDPKEGRLVVYCAFLMTKKRRNGLRSIEEFEKEPREEISVSIEFDLLLTIVLALNIRGGWEQRDVRRALDVLRVADLVTQPSPAELLVALPNTTAADARAVEERLREVVLEAAFGVATYNRDRESDTVEDLLRRTYRRPIALCGLLLAALLIVRAQRPVELAGEIF